MEKISSITFVVIALNLENVIKKCLDSIVMLNLINSEVICIDSGSTDKTLSVMVSYKTKFDSFKVFQINGDANPSIARNVGIENSSKKIIFFLDGDIELSHNFLDLALKEIDGGFDAVTGNLKEYQYDSSYQRILRRIESRTGFKKEALVYACGGTFITKKEYVDKIGLFDENLVRGEDNEFTLRLSENFKLLALPAVMGIHHTISYGDSKRIIDSLTKYQYIFFGMIFKRNFFNVKGLIYYSRIILPGILGGLALLIFMAVIFFFLKYPFNLFIILNLILLDVILGLFQRKSILRRIILHYVAPIFFLLGLFFSIKSSRNYSVERIEFTN